MLINLEQCQTLLNELENIQNIFKKYNCTEIKLFAPQFSSDQGKINFYVRDSDIAIYDAARLKHELKEAIGREDINIAFESRVEDDAKLFILKNTFGFTRETLESIRYQLTYIVQVKETSNDVYVTIKVPKNNSENLIENITNFLLSTVDHEVGSKQDIPISPPPSLIIKS